MYSFRKPLGVLLLVCASGALAQKSFDNIGRVATPREVQAWDIDVRSDFRGLPKGRGSASQGEKIWEEKCTSCHGSFGENNTVFFPLIGYTTKADLASGRVAALQPGADAPTRTTLMKLSQLSTLWDYINRAMPWNAPKSLSADDVYALAAYMLSLGNVVEADFTLSDENIAQVQKRLPNRNGMTTRHGMWPGGELGGTIKPDVQGSSCVHDCKVSVKVASLIPDYARNQHGNLAEQMRPVGGSRGVDTTRPAPAAPLAAAGQGRAAAGSGAGTGGVVAGAAAVKPSSANAASGGGGRAVDVNALLQKNACTACHALNAKVLGPSFRSIADKYATRSDAAAYLGGKIKNGGTGVWGSVAMPPSAISQENADAIAQWLSRGAR